MPEAHGRRRRKASAVYGAPAIGDVNGDGQNDVVFGSFDHNVYVLDNRCNTIAIKDNRDSIFSTPALYDIDGDGQMEIFIGGDATRNDAVPESFAGGVFRALRYNGTPGQICAECRGSAAAPRPSRAAPPSATSTATGASRS